jgi:hypothetical protein
VTDRLACRITVSTNCDTNVNYNQGCGTQVVQPGSYGEGFNSHEGGIYALARSKADGIKVWFWPRTTTLLDLAGISSNLADIPFDGDEDRVDPDKWGTPAAYFPTEGNCNYPGHFDAHRIVFDLTFCVRRVPSLPSLSNAYADDTVSRATGLVPRLFGSPANVLECLATTVGCPITTFLFTEGVDWDHLVVDQSPGRFANAYWEINSLRIYTPVAN